MEGDRTRPGGAVREWHVRVTLAEDGDDTTAEAVVETDAGARLTAQGHSHRSERDPSVPQIGDEVAVARALRNLADAVLGTATHDIESATGEHGVSVRPS